MTRVRSILGVIVGVVLVLSSAAHSLLGWKQLRADLAAAHAPPDLFTGLSIGWHFGGVAMLAFGLIVITLFVKRLTGNRVSLFPAAVIAVVYIVFGIWGLVVSNLNLFFLIFIVPGLLLALASVPEGRRRFSR